MHSFCLTSLKLPLVLVLVLTLALGLAALTRLLVLLGLPVLLGLLALLLLLLLVWTGGLAASLADPTLSAGSYPAQSSSTAPPSAEGQACQLLVSALPGRL
jgi:hypothetical protein